MKPTQEGHYWLRAKGGRVRHYVDSGGGRREAPLCTTKRYYFPQYHNLYGHKHYGRFCSKCMAFREWQIQESQEV